MIARLRVRPVLVPAFVAALALAACGDDDGGSDSTTTSSSTAVTVDTLEILVTNDDGYAAEGIDALVEGLLELPDVELRVVAPAENQSGSGDTTTPGPLVTEDVETLSGYPAVAVQGEPADSVVYALGEVYDEPPDLVVSGVNEGQNVGPLVELSGTVGAARVAARDGIPALAVSQVLGEPPDYPVAVDAAIGWITDNRDELAGYAGDVVSINAPTCTTGEVRGQVAVPLATDAEGALDPSDCASTLEDPASDIEALLNGYISLTVVDAEDPVPGN